MSEQQPETGAPGEQGAPDDTQEHEPTPDEAAPDEQSSGMEAADEMEEAQEAEDAKSEQVEGVLPKAQAFTQKQWEVAEDKLKREAERHLNRIKEIMGPEIGSLIACPMCDEDILGAIKVTPAIPERFPAVREFMGDAQPAEYQQDPNVHQCQSCGGQGMVATGSKVQGQEQLVCTDCGGKGWQGQRAPIPTSGPMAVQPLPDANGQSEVTPQGPEPPEAAKLRAMGYTLIQPVGA